MRSSAQTKRPDDGPFAAIGLRAKTGRAIAVVLRGDGDRPSFVARRELTLFDSRIPSGGPFHAVMDLPWAEAVRVARKFVDAVEAIATRELRSFLDELASRGVPIRCAGIVGSRDQSLERIGNPHIRAHAAEGILFRHALEVAAAAHDLPATTFTDKELQSLPAATLKRLGHEAGTPWRADEKAAASAAWIVLRAKQRH